MFVTTSRFQSGANKTAKLSEIRGIPIELMDTDRFYDALCIAQRTKYRKSDDKTAPFRKVPFSKMCRI